MNNENVYPAPKRIPPGTVVQVDGKDYMVVWSSFDAAYVQLAKITEDNALPPTTKPALAEPAPAAGSDNGLRELVAKWRALADYHATVAMEGSEHGFVESVWAHRAASEKYTKCADELESALAAVPASGAAESSVESVRERAEALLKSIIFAKLKELGYTVDEPAPAAGSEPRSNSNVPPLPDYENTSSTDLLHACRTATPAAESAPTAEQSSLPGARGVYKEEK